jgi:hypothetical protein
MQYRKLNELKKLPNNPRIIRDKQFKTLCDSIRDNPKYFEARPIILSDRTGEMVIIAGNQRYEAAKSLKLKEVPTFLIEGLDEAKEREIIIRDNISNGEFDFDLLANEWSDLPLVDWGVDLPEDWLKTEQQNELAIDDVKEDNPKLQKFIEAREKSRERGKDKNELNFWVCLVFQSYDQKHEFLKQLPENLQVKYGMYVDGESLAEAVGLEVNPNQQKPFESRLDNTLKERAL